MSEVVLYGSAPSPFVWTARMALEEKGVAYELTKVNIADPDYRAYHPFQRMPSLEHGEHRLFETLAICAYVDEAFEGPALMPSGALARAYALQWVSASNDYLFDSLIVRFVLERLAPVIFNRPGDEALVTATLPLVQKHLEILDRWLSGRLFFAGRQLSLADFFIAPIVHLAALQPEGAKALADLPDLSRWLMAMRKRPSFQASDPQAA